MTKRQKNVAIFVASAVLAPVLCLLLVGGVMLGVFIFRSDSNPQTDSRVNCDGYLTRVQPILDRWDDANAVASSSSRIALSGPLAELQAIRRDAIELAVPTCANEAHKHLVAYMNATIEGYLAFARQDDASVELYLDTAITLQDNFFAEIEKFD